MNYEDEELKPLSFNDDETEQSQLTFNSGSPKSSKKNTNKTTSYVPIESTLENGTAMPFINGKDSNFVFFFGTAASGKSVILSSMLYYLSSQAGVLRPKAGSPMEKDADVLFFDFLENLKQGILPTRTTRDSVTRLDMVFEPDNKSIKTPPIGLTFLETSGENHYEIRRGGEFHSSIDEYLNANIPLNLIIVSGYDKAHEDDVLINTFFNKLEQKKKNLKSAKVILVISKWDLSGSKRVTSEDILENFVRENLPMTYKRLKTYNISKSYYTIGNIEKNNSGEEQLTSLNLHTAGILSKWLYKSITGFDINYQGTLWERIKWTFSNINLKN